VKVYPLLLFLKLLNKNINKGEIAMLTKQVSSIEKKLHLSEVVERAMESLKVEVVHGSDVRERINGAILAISFLEKELISSPLNKYLMYNLEQFTLSDGLVLFDILESEQFIVEPKSNSLEENVLFYRLMEIGELGFDQFVYDSIVHKEDVFKKTMIDEYISVENGMEVAVLNNERYDNFDKIPLLDVVKYQKYIVRKWLIKINLERLREGINENFIIPKSLN